MVSSCSGGIACLKYVRVKVGKSLESSTPIFNGSLLSVVMPIVRAFCATFWLVANSFFGELSWLRGMGYPLRSGYTCQHNSGCDQFKTAYQKNGSKIDESFLGLALAQEGAMAQVDF